jgi:hypothetical protein
LECLPKHQVLTYFFDAKDPMYVVSPTICVQAIGYRPHFPPSFWVAGMELRRDITDGALADVCCSATIAIILLSMVRIVEHFLSVALQVFGELSLLWPVVARRDAGSVKCHGAREGEKWSRHVCSDSEGRIGGQEGTLVAESIMLVLDMRTDSASLIWAGCMCQVANIYVGII